LKRAAAYHWGSHYPELVKGTFAKVRLSSENLCVHPLDPLRPALRCLKGLGEGPSVSPHLPVLKLADDHEVQYLPVAVVLSVVCKIAAKSCNSVLTHFSAFQESYLGCCTVAAHPGAQLRMWGGGAAFPTRRMEPYPLIGLFHLRQRLVLAQLLISRSASHSATSAWLKQ
jgi:hypothetical protein